MRGRQPLVAPACFHIVGCVVIIYAIWGLTQFKQVLSGEKLDQALSGKVCTAINLTVEVVEPYTETAYKDCERFRDNLSRDKWYCFRVQVSNKSIVQLDECFTELPENTDVTSDYTVFTKPFKENPFEICLFVTVMLGCVLTIVWAFYMHVPPEKQHQFNYVEINGGAPFV